MKGRQRGALSGAEVRSTGSGDVALCDLVRYGRQVTSAPRSIAQWLALPELAVPDREVTLLVIKLGALFAPRGEALAEGIRDPWTPDETAADCQVVLGTVTINGSDGPELLRLPGGLAAWALDIMSFTRSGLRLLPCWFRLRPTGEGVEVAPVPGPPNLTDAAVAAPAHRPSFGQFTVFVDESGHAGDVASDPLRFGGQRVFALVGLGEDRGPSCVAEVFERLLTKHRVKAAEMKGRSMKRRPKFVGELVRELAQVGSIFIEVMDKKFFLATNIVSFALHCSTFAPFHESPLANEFADIITDYVHERAIVAYATFARTRDEESFVAFKEVFRAELLRSKLAMGPHQEHEFQLLREIESRFLRALHERRENLPGFIAPPDEDGNGRLIALLPHVSALAGLLARVNRHAERHEGFLVVHDRQKQLEPVLRDCLEQLDALSERMVVDTACTPSAAHENWAISGRVRLDFADSTAAPAIQAADVLARFCMQRMAAILSGTPADPRHDEAAALLHDLGRAHGGIGVRVVATTRDAERFWPTVRPGAGAAP